MKNIPKMTDAELASTYEQYRESYQRYLCSRGISIEDAEDIAQESFIRMLKALRTETFDGANVKGYQMTICHNLLVSFQRKLTTEQKHKKLVAADGSFISTPSVEAEIIENERNLAIREIVKNLCPDQREVTILHCFNRLKFREISEILNENPVTVRSRYQRAIITMRGKIPLIE